MPPILEVSGLSYSYHTISGETKALSDISFQVETGEFIAIVGHSGSGKSTFMNMLGCLDTPDSGEYFLDGKDVANLSDNELSDIRNHKIGFIFQGFNLIPNLDALGNVELPKSERKPFDKGIEEFYLETAERLQGEMVLITVGPLTNIARTIKKYPQFVKLVKHMYMMGGTLSMRGNVSPVAEANVACDPVAADYVFQSGMKITAVGLDVTMKVRFKRAYLDWIQTHCRPELKRAAEYLGKAFEWYFMGNQDRNYCMDDSPLHDPLAVMCASVPGLVLTQTRKARVECEGQYCRGMIVTDMREHPFEAETVEFAVEVDEKKAIGELLAAFWEK